MNGIIHTHTHTHTHTHSALKKLALTGLVKNRISFYLMIDFLLIFLYEFLLF